MIQFANEHTAPLVRRMWKICFNDKDEFMQIHFTYKYKNENTLIYFEGDEAVASLQMIPYTITFYGQEIPFMYLAGLCTYPEHRKRGYMADLILEAHKTIQERNIPLAILIPAEDWLYDFYRKYGYEQVFEKENVAIPLKDILDRASDQDSAYCEFDSLFRKKDFCVQKTKNDFEAIVKEYRLDGYPSKSNLSGMARIINPEILLSLYAKANPFKNFSIRVKEVSGDYSTYWICNGYVTSGSNYEHAIDIDICMLSRLLFGFNVKELESSYQSFFEEHHPIINLMLE